MDPERRVLALALLPSLAIHALLLSLNFGGLEPGLPSLDLPWRDRRGEVPELRVMLPPPPAAPAPVPLPPKPAPRATPVPAPEAEPGSASVWMVPAPLAATAPVDSRAAAPIVELPVLPDALPTPDALPERIVVASPADAEYLLPAAPPALPPAPAPLAPMPEPAPPAPLPAAPLPAAAASSPEPAPAAVAAEAERMEALRQAAAREESARLEAERAEAARQAAAAQEQARREAARLEAARLETARLDAEREAAAKREAARLEAARIEAAKLEAAKLEAARQEAARQEAARQEQDRLEAARQQAARDEEESRQARRRAMGRQLDAEAAQRAANNLPSSWSGLRRGRLFGRADPNAEMVQYAEAWARRIELNTAPNTVQQVAHQRHADPMVTVALRSDGSIESITFVSSSGVPEIDETIRRIVQDLAPHPGFPPALAREYDVIEIRRTWTFDSAVRLF